MSSWCWSARTSITTRCRRATRSSRAISASRSTSPTAFLASDATRRASGVFVAHVCERLGLPHFSAAAVAALIEDSHRQSEDQARQCAAFAHRGAGGRERGCRAGARRTPVEAEDVAAALQAQRHRHDYLEQRLRETIADGERIIALDGARVGQLNGLTVIDPATTASASR